jgi:predicted GNAT family acetyltransferase
MRTIFDKNLQDRIKGINDLDFKAVEAKKEVFNLIETLCQKIIEQAKEIEQLRDEINKLKGENGTPKFKAKAPINDKDEIKLESNKKERIKRSKVDRIKIDRTETIKLDKTGLPDDLEFKGYAEKIVQNILIKTDNVLYRFEKYYSPSEGKTYTAEVEGNQAATGFGAETKALISTLYYENRVTENKIASFLNSNGLHISEGTVSNILIKEQSETLSKIKEEIFEAGLSSSIYQQIDDTGMRIGGENGYATIVCNEKYSAYFINKSKSRETIKSFLTERLAALFIVLVGDDAPQFKKIAARFALCWIHEERHYKKETPILEYHKKELKRVRGEIWEYYKKLADYKKMPTEEKKAELLAEFDVLFGQITTYDELNKRLSLTNEKKDELLTVLDFPEVPLHNNVSETGEREVVMKRKISGGVKTEEGVKAWENNLSILATCKKLGVSFYDFMVGVFSNNMTINLPPLILKSNLPPQDIEQATENLP